MYKKSLKQSLAITLIALIVVRVSGNGRYRRSSSCAPKFRQFPGHSACLSKSSSAVTFDLTPGEKQALVDQHNQMRKSVTPAAADMLKMSWDDEVAMIAKKWTDSCKVVTGDSLNHDKNYHRLIPGRFSVGQNLGFRHAAFAVAVQFWYNETKDYHYGQPFSTHTADIGHYTQLVWAKSYKLGCSKTRCDGKMVYACNYAPAGNVGDFEKPYKTGTSTCKTQEGALCDCGNLQCVNGSPLDIATCTCKCTPQYFLDENCNFNCTIKDPETCGTAPYVKDQCHEGVYAVSISQQCPHMCSVCPYAEQGYKGSSIKVMPPMTWLYLVGLFVALITMERPMEFLA